LFTQFIEQLKFANGLFLLTTTFHILLLTPPPKIIKKITRIISDQNL